MFFIQLMLNFENSPFPASASCAGSPPASPMWNLNVSNQNLLQVPSYKPKRTDVSVLKYAPMAQFPTNEGLRHLCFQIIPASEMEVYLNSIVRNELVRQPVFTSEQLHSPQRRDQMASFMLILHGTLGFKVQTLHLAVSVADKYLSVRTIKDFEYEVLGITALWMSAKIQETKIPHFSLWLAMGSGCLQQQLLEFQHQILKVFGFNLYTPTSISLFNLILTQTPIQQRAFFLCHYLLELSIVSSKYLDYRYNVVTLSAFYLALSVCDREAWDQNFYCSFLGATQKEVDQCANELLQSMMDAQSQDRGEVYAKFSRECFLKVGQITFGLEEPKQRSLSGKSTVSTNSN